MSTYDLSLYAGNKSSVAIGNVGRVVTGVLKASQRFSDAFLTEKGTSYYDSAYGSDFLTYMRLGTIRTDFDVVSYFNQAAADVVAYLKGTQPVDALDDEVIASVSLDHFELDLPTLVLYALITTLSGNSRVITLPANTTGS